jgi:hypothetical protein
VKTAVFLVDSNYVLNKTHINTNLRRMRWAGHVARMGEKRNAYRILVGKPEGKETTGKTRT